MGNTTPEAAGAGIDHLAGPAARRWAAQAYRHVAAVGVGAEKLAGSAVAPLVAAARGYESITPAGLKPAAGRLRVGALNSRAGAQFRSIVGVHGALMLPWHGPATARRAVTGRRPMPTVAQFRPVDPRTDPDTGRVVKYEFLTGAPTTLDVHPATPARWLDHTPAALVTEGVLKGDAALTGLLRGNGVTDRDLEFDGTGDPIERLRGLLAALPDAEHLLVVSLSGVTAWHRNPEWAQLTLTGRRVLVGFDGDLRVNWDVWNQAEQLCRRLTATGATPAVLDLPAARPAGAMGVDDYLATTGDYRSLLALAMPALPPAPDRGQPEPCPGDWRIDPVTRCAEEFVAGRAGRGTGDWEPRTRFAGRVAGILTRRSASDREAATGELDAAGEAMAETTVQIDVDWFDPDTGHARRALVTGPVALLADDPRDWHKERHGGNIPAALLSHPDWPPERAWLAAVKKHRRADTETRTVWDHMGWVPVDGGTPVYLVGRQAVGAHGFTDCAVPGVDNTLLAGADRFGVIADDDEDRLRGTVLEVLDTYLRGTWSDPRVAALVLAAALRPVAPRHCHTVLSVVGPKGHGKSFTAATVMSFWQATPGAWAPNRLPGSAQDTVASTETAVARTNIWVVDDLAPSPNRRTADAEQDRMGTLIRNVHNRAAKRRSTPGLRARQVHDPRALLIVTAENDAMVSSVADRVIRVPITRGSLGPDAAVDRMRDLMTSGRAATVTYGAIRAIAAAGAGELSHDGTWAGHTRFWDEEHRMATHETQDVMPGGAAARHQDLAADITLGLTVWHRLLTTLGLTDRAAAVLDLADGIFSLVADHYQAQQETSPGQSILLAVRSLLAAGLAHLQSVDTPGAPPMTGTDDAAVTNSRLGWIHTADGVSRPGGPTIGYLINPTGARGIPPHALLDPKNSFTQAQRQYPDLIPYGSTERAAWTSAWTENLVTEQHWQRRLAGNGAKRTVVRVLVNGTYLEGVPVPLDVLFGLQR